MVLRCIHGLPRTNCVYCSKLNDILNQDTMSYRKLMRLVTAVSVYSRLGTPSVRRARSTTPMSTLRPASPGSNNNNSNRFSPPRVKRPRKSG